jgi:hypothetical protein
MMDLNRLISALLCVLLTSSARATSVAIVVTRTEIVIGTDGVNRTINTNGITTFGAYCKIRKERTTFFTGAGTYWMPAVNFDLWGLAKEAILKTKTTEGIYDLIEPVIFARLPDVVRLSKSSDPENYARWLRGIPIIAISFASIEHGVPVVATIYFQIDRAGKIVKPAARKTLYGATGRVQYASLGYNNEMNAVIAPPTWGIEFNRNPIGFVSGLIQKEIDASTAERRYDVGLPISIFRISMEFTGWEPGYEGACKAGL